MTGPVVAVAAPPVAVTPVSDGIEKYVPAQAAGAAVDMLAASLNVTVRLPFAPTVTGVVSGCDDPLLADAKLHETPLFDAVHPVFAVVSPESP